MEPTHFRHPAAYLKLSVSMSTFRLVMVMSWRQPPYCAWGGRLWGFYASKICRLSARGKCLRSITVYLALRPAL